MREFYKLIDRGSLRSHFGYLYLINSLAATFFWVYFLSDGFQAAGLLDGVYDLQADALARFRLSIEPGPLECFYFDVSLYDGKYYYYQGLLPAILHAGLMQILGRGVSSYLVAAGFLFCFLYFFQRIIGDIVDCALRAERSHQFWLRLSSLPLLWLFAFNLPLPFDELNWFFGRFSIYEQQVIFALAVAMAGLFALLRGLKQQNTQLVCSAAFIFAVAAWARGSWFIYAGIAVAAACLYCLSKSGVFRIRLQRQRLNQGCACDSARGRIGSLGGTDSGRAFGWLAASTVLLCGILVLNIMRFDSFLDFGLRHQNPTSYVYLRKLTGIFSPVTRLWDFGFNLLAYWGSPGLVKGLGLLGKTSSDWEYLPPSFFYFNPLFLPVLVLAPLGVYRAFRKNWNLFLAVTVIGLTAGYMSVFITAAPTFTILRLFIEFYYWALLFFFLVVVALIPYRFALPLLILLTAAHLPGNFLGFATARPEIRLVDPGKSLRRSIDASAHKLPTTPFIEKDVVWLRETVSYDNRDQFREYNLIGVYPGSSRMLLSRDVAALYVVPDRTTAGDSPKQDGLLIRRMQSIGRSGNVRFYLDGRHIGDLAINAKTPVDGRLPFEKKLRQDAPYQVLVIFIPAGEKFLPPRPAAFPALTFKEIALKRGFY